MSNKNVATAVACILKDDIREFLWDGTAHDRTILWKGDHMILTVMGGGIWSKSQLIEGEYVRIIVESVIMQGIVKHINESIFELHYVWRIMDQEINTIASIMTDTFSHERFICGFTHVDDYRKTHDATSRRCWIKKKGLIKEGDVVKLTVVDDRKGLTDMVLDVYYAVVYRVQPTIKYSDKYEDVYIRIISLGERCNWLHIGLWS